MIKKAYNYYKKLSIVAKATIWYMICSIIQKGINIITTPIFTRLMTTEEFGLYSVYLSWESIFIIFTSLRLDYTVFNKGMSKYKSNRDGYVASMQIITTVLSGVFLAFYLLFRYQINAFTELSTTIMLLIIMQCLFYPSYNFWMIRERYEYRYIRFALVVFVLTVLNAFLGIVFIKILPGNNGFIRIVVNSIIYSLIGLILYIINFKKGIRKSKKEHIKFALLFNIPMIPHYLSMYILHQMDRVMIQKMVSMAKTGIYSVASGIGNVMTIISQSFVNAVTPWYYDKLENKRFDDVKKIFFPVMITMWAIVLIFLMVIPELMYFFAPMEYHEAIYIVPPVAASVLFQTLYSFFSIPEYYYDANKFSMIASMIAAVTNIITNYIFIKMFGYLAAGFTTLFCNFLMALCHYVYCNMIFKKKQISYFSRSEVSIICIVSITGPIICCLLYNFLIVRYTLFAISILLIVLNKKKILDIIKRISTNKDSKVKIEKTTSNI